MKLNSRKGFTLVELIIVIAILGIIALIAVPSLTNVQKSSQVNADIRTAEQIGKAVRIWLTDADINTANTREDAIDGKYVILSSNTLTDLSKYISTSYKPQALKSSDFYISLAAGDKIVVAINTAAYTAKPTALYSLNANEEAAAGVAYIEGLTSFVASDIPAL